MGASSQIELNELHASHESAAILIGEPVDSDAEEEEQAQKKKKKKKSRANERMKSTDPLCTYCTTDRQRSER